MSAIVVSCACATREEAERIATALVAQRLAACVQLCPVESVYRWRGEVERADEVLLQIKTVAARLPAIEACVGELHSHDLPEVLAVPVAGGSAAYLAWVAAEAGG